MVSYKNLSLDCDRFLQLDLSGKLSWDFGTRCKIEIERFKKATINKGFVFEKLIWKKVFDKL